MLIFIYVLKIIQNATRMVYNKIMNETIHNKI